MGGFNNFGDEDQKKTKNKKKGKANEMMRVQGSGAGKESEVLKQLKAKGVSKGLTTAGGVAFEVPSTSSKQTRGAGNDDGVKKKQKSQ